MRLSKTLSLRTTALSVLGLLSLQSFVLFLYGQPALCKCGVVTLWEGVVASSGNSQQVTDWYSFSHVIHGILFFFLLRWLFPRASYRVWLLLALGIEISWELLENTPMVIQHYREQALAQDYTGDSILNSVSDSLSMLVGFVLAYRLPTWLVVYLVIFLELWVGYMIRDNLTLNVINLIYPFPWIAAWQAGA